MCNYVCIQVVGFGLMVQGFGEVVYMVWVEDYDWKVCQGQGCD